MTHQTLSKNSLFNQGRLLDPKLWFSTTDDEIWLLGPETTLGLAVHAGDIEVGEPQTNSHSLSLEITPKGSKAVKLRPVFVATGEILKQSPELSDLLRHQPGQVRANRFYQSGGELVWEYVQPGSNRSWRLSFSSRDVDHSGPEIISFNKPQTFHYHWDKGHGLANLSPAFAAQKPKLAWLAGHYLAAGSAVEKAEFLAEHQGQLLPSIAARLYHHLSLDFKQVYRKAETQTPEYSVDQLVKFAGEWGELSWWQNNLQLPLFILTGMRFCQDVEIVDFQSVAHFTVEALCEFAEPSLVYSEQWLGDFLDGNLLPLSESITSRSLMTSAQKQLQAHHTQLQLESAKIARAFDNFP